MCTFHSKAFPYAIAYLTESTLTFGTIDEIQKLHVESISVGETPRRIAWQEETRSFGVVSIRSGSTELEAQEDDSFWFRVFDDSTFEGIYLIEFLILAY